MEVALEICRKEDLRFTFWIDSDPGKACRSVQIGYSADFGTVRLHCPEIDDSISIALKHDFGTVRCPVRIVFTAGVTGQPDRLAPFERHFPEISSPTEDDCGSIWADRREPGEIDIAVFCSRHCRRHRHWRCRDLHQNQGQEDRQEREPRASWCVCWGESKGWSVSHLGHGASVMSEIETQEHPHFVESISRDALSSPIPAFGLCRLAGLQRQVRCRNGREAGIKAKIESQQPDAPFITLGRA